MPEFRKSRCIFSLLLILSLLSACQPALTPAPLATPHILTVQTTPALQSIGTLYRDCADDLQNTGLVISNTPAPLLNLNDAALALRWGLQSNSPEYAAVIGQESLAVIVSAKSPLNTIAQADLQAIYQGTLRAWPGTDQVIEPWTYPEGDDAAQVFEAVVMSRPVTSRALYTAPDPNAMLEAVAKSPNAVGYLPSRWLNTSVKPIVLDGIEANQLRQPILALSKLEPNGPEKSWLLCLQQGLSE